MERNITALLERREREAKDKRMEERVADNITRFFGSMNFVYLHLVLFGLWVAIDLGWLPFLSIKRFDPSFVVLAMFASVKAMAEKMGVEGALDPELEELAKDVWPEKVMDEMERAVMGRANTHPRN